MEVDCFLTRPGGRDLRIVAVGQIKGGMAARNLERRDELRRQRRVLRMTPATQHPEMHDQAHLVAAPPLKILRVEVRPHAVHGHVGIDEKVARYGTKELRKIASFEVSRYDHDVADAFMSLIPALFVAGSGQAGFRNLIYRAGGSRDDHA